MKKLGKSKGRKGRWAYQLVHVKHCKVRTRVPIGDHDFVGDFIFVHVVHRRHVLFHLVRDFRHVGWLVRPVVIWTGVPSV